MTLRKKGEGIQKRRKKIRTFNIIIKNNYKDNGTKCIFEPVDMIAINIVNGIFQIIYNLNKVQNTCSLYLFIISFFFILVSGHV